MRRLTKSLCSAVLLLGIATDAVHAEDDELPIEGLLENPDASAEKMERRVLGKGAAGDSFRILDGLYVLRAPSESAWEDVIGPALEEATESERPIESLKTSLLGLGSGLLAGPETAGAKIRFDLPGERGRGFVAFVPPPLIGPDAGSLNSTEPNKIRTVTGVAIEEAESKRNPVIESFGLQSTPQQWTGGSDAALPKLNPLGNDGADAWVKWKGRSNVEQDGDAFGSAMESVMKSADRSRLSADRMMVWPGSSGDQEAVKDVLTAARYHTRVLKHEGSLTDELRREDRDWEWSESRVKHPVRYGIATVAMNAEVDDGKGLQERAEIFGFVFLYSALWVTLDEAPLYCGTSPEFFARALQKGELPFFDREGEPYFYTGHLDRWVAGEDLRGGGRMISRSKVEGLIEKWTAEIDSKDAGAVRGLGKSPNHWPLRLVEADDEDSDKAFDVRISTADLATWLHQVKPTFRPDEDFVELGRRLDWEPEGVGIDLGVALQGGDVELSSAGAAAVASADSGSKSEASRREEASLSTEDRAKLEAQKKAQDDEARAESARRAEEDRKREEARKAEDAKRAEEERKREEQRLAAAKAAQSPLDLRLRNVTVGTPVAGKPYLATKAGSSVPVKVDWTAAGTVSGHKAEMSVEAFDPKGSPVAGFAVKAPLSLKEGDGTLTSYLKVPSTLTKPENMGSYRVVTRLVVDGVPAEGEREEFVHLGSPIQLHRIELDPQVVVPDEDVELLMDLQVGGWPSEEPVKMTVATTWVVGQFSKTESFPLSRGVGYHELGVDLTAPAELPAGDGSFVVVVSEPSGAKSTSKATVRVFSKDVVAGGSSERSGSTRRVVEDEEEDPLAGVKKEQAAKGEEEEEREYVRRASKEDEEDVFEDDEDLDLDEEEKPARKKSSSGSSASGSSSGSSSSSKSSSASSGSSSAASSRDSSSGGGSSSSSSSRESSSDSAASGSGGAPSSETVDKAIRSVKGIGGCLGAEEQKGQPVSGKITMEFDIVPNGTVSGARVSTEGLSGTSFDKCIGKELSALRFQPWKGEPKHVAYPITVQLSESAKKAQESKRAEEAKRAEDARRAEEARQADEAKKAEASKKAEEDKKRKDEEEAKKKEAEAEKKAAAAEEEEPEEDLEEEQAEAEKPEEKAEDESMPEDLDLDEDEEESSGKGGKGKADESAKSSKSEEKAAKKEKAAKEEKPAKAEKEKPAKEEKPAKAEKEKPAKEEKPAKAEKEKPAKEEKASKKAADEDEDLHDDGELPDEDADLDLEEEKPAASKKSRSEEEAGTDELEPEDEEDAEQIAEMESESLHRDDWPENVYDAESEDDVLLEAESDGHGVLHVFGDAEKRLIVWLGEHDEAVKAGAPPWYILVHGGGGAGKLVFSRYSNSFGDWAKVHEAPSKWATPDEEKAALAQIREVFYGLVPAQKKRVPFGKL